MGKSIKRDRTPSWYIDGDMDKTLNVIFDLIKQRYRDDQIAKHFNVPITTVKGFLGKKVKDKVLKFRKTLDVDHPRSIGRCLRARWLINESREETSAFITNKIAEGFNRTEIAAMFTEMSGITVTSPMVCTYMANHMNVDNTEKMIDEALTRDNRFFSIHVIGSKPEALDRLQGVA